MKIAVLTSSRADYGIYQPLLAKLKADARFKLEIIAFGMHLQKKQGNTIRDIRRDDYSKIHLVGAMPENDKVFDIAYGYGALLSDFAHFWKQHNYDLIFALGDRWEMSAAVQSSIPYELKIAHVHGGETTLGATDNIYRHQISLAAHYHFTAAEPFSERVKCLINKNNGVYTVGSISLEDLKNLELPDWSEVKKHFNIPFDEFILVTFHPESVGSSMNEFYAKLTYAVLEELIRRHNILITAANSDVMGSLFNQQFELLQEQHPEKIKLVSALGKLNYFKAMQRCSFMLGNTSSGIVEAASFRRWVLNVGDRQKGRLRNENVIDVPFETEKILNAVSQVGDRDDYKGENIYVMPGTTDSIIKIISQDARL